MHEGVVAKSDVNRATIALVALVVGVFERSQVKLERNDFVRLAHLSMSVVQEAYANLNRIALRPGLFVTQAVAVLSATGTVRNSEIQIAAVYIRVLDVDGIARCPIDTRLDECPPFTQLAIGGSSIRSAESASALGAAGAVRAAGIGITRLNVECRAAASPQ